MTDPIERDLFSSHNFNEKIDLYGVDTVREILERDSSFLKSRYIYEYMCSMSDSEDKYRYMDFIYSLVSNEEEYICNEYEYEYEYEYKFFSENYLYRLVALYFEKNSRNPYMPSTAINYILGNSIKYGYISVTKLVFLYYLDKFDMDYDKIIEKCYTQCISSPNEEMLEFLCEKFKNYDLKKYCNPDSYPLGRIVCKNLNVLIKLLQLYNTVNEFTAGYFTSNCIKDKDHKRQLKFILWLESQNTNFIETNSDRIITFLWYEYNHNALKYIYKLNKDRFIKFINGLVYDESGDQEYFGSGPYYFNYFVEKVLHHNFRNEKFIVMYKLYYLLHKQKNGKQLIHLWFSPNGLGGIRAKKELTNLFGNFQK